MDTKATGALIAQRRKQLAPSQAELAERLHVTDKAVSRWETGRGMPGLDSLEPLSKELGLSISELLSGKELAMAALAVWGIAVSTQAQRGRARAEQERAERYAHYTSSVNPNYQEDLAEATAGYF